MKPQLAKNLKDIKKLKKEYIVQPKYDGFRLLVTLDNNKLKYTTRNEKDKSDRFQFLNTDLKPILENLPPNTFIDGEILAIKNNKYLPINNLTPLFNKKTPFDINDLDFNLEYIIFDTTTSKPQLERLEELSDITKETIFKHTQISPYNIITKEKAFISSELEEIANKYIKEGFEGAIFRDSKGNYKPKSRNNSIIKQKASERPEITAKLTKATFGSGKYAEIYSKYTWSIKDANSNFIEISNATSGLTHEEILSIHNTINSSLSTPLIIADIQYDNISKTKDKPLSLRFPIIKQLRPDLTLNDISNLKDIE